MYLKLIFVILLLAPATLAQRVVDPEFIVDTSALAAGWAVDTASTAYGFAQSPSRVEHGGLLDGSRSTVKVMGAWAAVDAGLVLTAYEWKKRVHNKYLHPLWRAFLLVPAATHVSAAIGNYRSP